MLTSKQVGTQVFTVVGSLLLAAVDSRKERRAHPDRMRRGTLASAHGPSQRGGHSPSFAETHTSVNTNDHRSHPLRAFPDTRHPTRDLRRASAALPAGTYKRDAH